jgi:hypothetical protein
MSMWHRGQRLCSAMGFATTHELRAVCSSSSAVRTYAAAPRGHASNRRPPCLSHRLHNTHPLEAVPDDGGLGNTIHGDSVLRAGPGFGLKEMPGSRVRTASAQRPHSAYCPIASHSCNKCSFTDAISMI